MVLVIGQCLGSGHQACRTFHENFETVNYDHTFTEVFLEFSWHHLIQLFLFRPFHKGFEPLMHDFNLFLKVSGDS